MHLLSFYFSRINSFVIYVLYSHIDHTLNVSIMKLGVKGRSSSSFPSRRGVKMWGCTACSSSSFFFFFLACLFETDLTYVTRLFLNSWFSCFRLPTAGITDMYLYAWASLNDWLMQILKQTHLVSFSFSYVDHLYSPSDYAQVCC
jgi:hypothetical protein